MDIMKPRNLLLTASVTAIVLTGASASAQSMRFSDVDSDGNGQLSYDELQSAFGTRGANQLWERGGGQDLSRSDIRSMNASRDDNDDDGGSGGSGGGGGRDDDDDDGGSGGSGGGGGRDDDDDDGGSGGWGGGGGRDDDDDDD
jgi:hypothetical protein